MLLYIHVPFCKSKCRYCAFYSELLRNDDLLLLWKESLLKEMAHRRNRLKTRNIESIFFGGGTPSLLPPSLFEEILSAVSDVFSVESNAEISIEANPESVSKYNAEAYLHCGINRISLGVQTWDNTLLRTLGRIHSSEKAEEAFHILRDAGFRNIGIDLMWGLPTENSEQWGKELEKTLSLKPEHLSCYGLTLEEGTILAQQKNLSLPSEEEEERMYFLTRQLSEQYGYRQYEISNYALPDMECRHNMGYWYGKDYLGLGPGAVSTIGGRRWENPPSLKFWKEHTANTLVDSNADELTSKELLEEFVMLRLRMSEGLPLKEFEQRTGCNFQTLNQSFLDELCQKNYAECTDEFFCLTTAGMLKSNAIISRIFETLPKIPE